jgi:diguanylate cyclase (GGDEF)-like protein
VAEALLAVTGVARPDEAAHLRRIAEDLERSAAGGDDPDVVARSLPRHGPRPRVLVADDDADAREALAEVLQPECEVITAADGEQAVQLARDDHPDLVLMDLFMPRLDGLQALERMRGDPATAELPVIFVSARGEASVKARALDLGAVDYLQKPFSDRELRARVERTLRLARSQTALRALAQTDPLTGLANMRAFRARLEDEVKRARRYRTPLTCVMADMDHLKPVNDQLGHTAGDRAIAGVAGVIRAELRETDFGARYGGDEFVLLLPHTGADEGRVLAERVCARLRETVLEVAGRRVPLGASFGVACLPGDAGEGAADALVRAADAALYRAKRSGRGRVATAGPSDADGPRENA